MPLSQSKAQAKGKLKVKTLLIVLVVAALTVFYFSKQPQQTADWKQPYLVMPQATLDGDTLTIKNFRDFRYSETGEVEKAHYRDARFQLSQLKSIWLGLSHFGPYGLAHALASFEFSNNKYLTISIEARLTNQQKSYGPVTGLFPNYTKFVVLGSEKDIIGLRSHVRGERVYLYSLQGTELQAKTLLLSYLRQTQYLIDTPEFYNTVTDNCFTGLLAESKQYRQWWQWIDYRILLPGFADRLLIEDGIIANRGGIEATRARALIKPSASDMESPQFSQRIRKIH